MPTLTSFHFCEFTKHKSSWQQLQKNIKRRQIEFSVKTIFFFFYSWLDSQVWLLQLYKRLHCLGVCAFVTCLKCLKLCTGLVNLNQKKVTVEIKTSFSILSTTTKEDDSLGLNQCVCVVIITDRLALPVKNADNIISTEKSELKNIARKDEKIESRQKATILAVFSCFHLFCNIFLVNWNEICTGQYKCTQILVRVWHCVDTYFVLKRFLFSNWTHLFC